MENHPLEGCTPIPLAGYLKALGILRIVSEQFDPAARGWWDGDRFTLASTRGIGEIEKFFLTSYSPSPVLSPWNGGSGFYPKDQADAINAIEGSSAERFASYRSAIGACRDVVGANKEKPSTDTKADFLDECRARLSQHLGQWMSSAFIVVPDPKTTSPLLTYPSLLGTGGNDGRLDFSNNFMQRLCILFDVGGAGDSHGDAQPLLVSAIHGTPVAGLIKASIGQFSPSCAGGANASAGFKADGLHNPWDFILMLEGAMMFTSAVSRRYESEVRHGAAAPFAFRSEAAGDGSICVEENRGRGEQWMPLWKNPATSGEVSKLLREGRGQIAGHSAQTATQFARSIARLGVARGIAAFQRYGYVERNGLSTLATPLGRWQVAAQPHQNLLDEVAPWVDRLSSMAADERAPASIRVASRNAQEGLLRCCQNGQSGESWRRLATAISDALLQYIQSSKFVLGKRAKPLPSLSPEWLEVLDDGSDEFHLATALASRPKMESFWFPVAGRPKDPFFLQREDAFKDEQRKLVARGINLVDDLVAVGSRKRILASQGLEEDRVVQPYGVRDLASIDRFLRADTDDGKILHLLPFLFAIRWRDAPPRKVRRDLTFGIPPHFALLRLATIGKLRLGGDHEIEIRREPEILRHLASGDLRGASHVAIRRLRSSGLHPVIRELHGGKSLARRLAASLSFGCHAASIPLLYGRVIKPGSLDRITTATSDSQQ